MAIEINGIKLTKISRINTLEKAGFVRHRIPGMEGELAQNLGRPSVRLQIEGIYYGPKAQEGLEQLRKVHLDKEPVEFLADIIGKSYFAMVVLDRFDVVQDAQAPDQYSYLLEIVEYVEPPKPVLLDIKGVDAGILQDAQQFMNIVQLPDQLQLPELKDPTVPMQDMLTGVQETLNPLQEEQSTLTKIFGEV
ncbi:MAG TPA: hypothetical protein PK228_10285 [Saprospiraceae bacterium]|nr:hypothetical protein [Saprospiraceae bacterium]